ncbi:MAG: alpha/beta hydrolase [Planctomycetota bacterium]|jgi:esterase/lipase superfamily enzyme
MTPLLVVLCLLAGCGQRELIETPNLYLEPDLYPFADVPSPLRTNTVDILYATDRKREGDEDDPVKYGYRRSDSVACGSLIVEIGRDVTWDELVEASRTKKRKVSLPLKVVSIDERGRFPETPAPIVFEGEVAQETPEYLAAEKKAQDALHEGLRRRLALTPRKEAFVFVHGYNNTLEVAAFRMAPDQELHLRSRVQRVHGLPPQGVPEGAGGIPGARDHPHHRPQPRLRRGRDRPA